MMFSRKLSRPLQAPLACFGSLQAVVLSMFIMTPQVYQLLEKIAVRIEQSYLRLENVEAVPDFIRSSRSWSLLRNHIEATWLLSCSRGGDVTVLLLQLSGDVGSLGDMVVIKACSAAHAKKTHEQIMAEVRMAKTLSWNPLMATLLCCEQDAEGNVVMISPYAGVCLADIQHHPDWQDKLTERERVEVFAALEAHSMKALALLQEADSYGGYWYRDTKPDNLAYDWRTRQFKLIDFGLVMHSNCMDYHDGFTPGFITPEMCEPGEDKKYEAFMVSCMRPATLNPTTDVFLHGMVGLDLIHGLPAHLKPEAFDISSQYGVLQMLKVCHKVKYPALIKRISNRTCKSYLRQAMHLDPEQRLTPTQALKHPFLTAAAAAMQSQVEQTSAAHAKQAASVVSLLEGLASSKTVMYLATEQHKQWLLQQQQPEHGGEGDSIASPPTPVCRSSNNSITKLSSSSSSSSTTGSNLGSSDSACDVPAVTAADVEAVVTVKSTSTGKSRWLKKGLQCFRKVMGSSSNSKIRQAKDKSNGSNYASEATATIPANPMVLPVQPLEPDGDLSLQSTSVKVKVPGLCGLRFSFKSRTQHQ